MNFLVETLNELSKNNKKPSDIEWIGSEEFGYFAWKDFEELANFEYNSDKFSVFSKMSISKDLIIVGKNWWMERTINSYGENWTFKTFPTKPKNFSIPVNLKNSSLF